MKVAILHEGSDKKTADNELLKLLMKALHFNEEKVLFYGMGAKNNFFDVNNKNYALLKMHIRKQKVNKILLMVDADYKEKDEKYGGYKNTQYWLNETIKNLNWESYSSLYITCDPATKEGYLESFILSTIPEQQKNCIENFLACSEFKSKENHKAILNQIYKIAYPKSPFDFSHQHFDELKQKLTKLFVK